MHEATFFAALHNAVSELIELPQLIVLLAMPIKDCERMHGHSGTHLLTCLRELEYEITSVARYREATVPGKGTPPPAAGAERPQPADIPKDHIVQGPGKPCYNTRDLGECKLKGCRALHKDQGFTKTDCTDPLYLEMGLCPGYSHSAVSGKLCLHKHTPISRQ